MNLELNIPAPLDQVIYRFPEPLIPGRLIRRRNRFVAEIRLEDGAAVEAHCPNSGTMKTCLEDDAPVYVSPAANPNRKTRYTWEMIYLNNGWIGVNTGIPNFLAAEAARLQTVDLFRGVTEVRREVTIHKGTRLDLVADKPSGPVYVEVKNVTMVYDGGLARFPDAVTSRGAKHLRELMDLKAQGFETAALFIVQRTDAVDFGPAEDIDPTYAELLRQADQAGVNIIVLEARVSPTEIHLTRPLPIAL